MSRGDDVIHQAEYWLAEHGTKASLPGILKRSWAWNISGMNAYTMAKYSRSGMGLIDVVRICHAKGPLVDTLMRTGKVSMPAGENTWERLRASGSSWNTILHEIRLPHVALLRNLRGIFSEVRDKTLREQVTITKDRGVLKRAQQVSDIGRRCGMATENGIWLFFRDAILKKQHWDHIFVYSDMQAGHGGLYGIDPQDYEALGAACNGMYIDVNMLVNLYRERVNPKVNVYCIQTAGYTNVLVPEYGYRTAILYGWTGKELLFADALQRTWQELEDREDLFPEIEQGR